MRCHAWTYVTQKITTGGIPHLPACASSTPAPLLSPRHGRPCFHFPCHTRLPRFLLPLTGGRYIVVGKGSQSWCEVPASLLHSVFVLSLSGSPKVLQVLMQPDRGRNGAGVGGGNRRGRCEPVSLFLENECNFHSFPWKLSPAVECLTAGCRGVALVSNGPGNGFALSLYLVPQR